MQTDKKVKSAVNGGISYGAKLNAKQLMVLADYFIKSRKGYNLYIGGNAKGAYAENGKRREPFYKFVNRFGVEFIRQEITQGGFR